MIQVIQAGNHKHQEINAAFPKNPFSCKKYLHYHDSKTTIFSCVQKYSIVAQESSGPSWLIKHFPHENCPAWWGVTKPMRHAFLPRNPIQQELSQKEQGPDAKNPAPTSLALSEHSCAATRKIPRLRDPEPMGSNLTDHFQRATWQDQNMRSCAGTLNYLGMHSQA